MNLIAIEDFINKNQLSHVYIQSPRWNDEKIVSLSKTGNSDLPYISVDSSVDEGVIGNTCDEIETGNRLGRFLNSEEAVLYDDYEIVPHKEGLEKFKKDKDICEEKYYSNLNKKIDVIEKELAKWN